MEHVAQEMVEAFVRACHQAAACGLMRCSSGNFSMRVDGGRLLVKASRSWMARVTPADVSLCAISDGSLIEGRGVSPDRTVQAEWWRYAPGKDPQILAAIDLMQGQ